MSAARLVFYSLVLFLFLSSSKITAQIAGSFQIEAMTEGNYYWKNSDFSITTGFGLNLWLADHIALNYEFQFGYDNRYGLTLNTGWGQALAGIILAESSKTNTNEIFGVIAFLAFLVPEGVTFAINPDDDLVFMPYVMPLELTYLYLDDPQIRCSGEIGLKVHYILKNNMAIRPKIGLRCLYSKDYKLGIEVGIGLMLFATD